MGSNEGPCRREPDRADLKLPVEHGVAAIAIAHAAQPVAGDLLRTETAQQLASPGGVVIHASRYAV